MTLSVLLESLKISGLEDMSLYISHLKPQFVNEILDELQRAGRRHIKPLKQGTVMII